MVQSPNKTFSILNFPSYYLYQLKKKPISNRSSRSQLMRLSTNEQHIILFIRRQIICKDKLLLNYSSYFFVLDRRFRYPYKSYKNEAAQHLPIFYLCTRTGWVLRNCSHAVRYAVKLLIAPWEVQSSARVHGQL